MPYHDAEIKIRIQSKYVLAVKRLVEKNDEKYDSAAHFCRASIISKLREEGMIPRETPMKSYEVKKR